MLPAFAHTADRLTQAMARLLGLVVAILFLVLYVSTAAAEEEPKVYEYANDRVVGIEQNLGGMLPKDVTFKNSKGEDVTIGSLLKKPTIITFVYFRCKSICSPIMHELARTVDEVNLVAGRDFDLITISFDSREGPELSATAKKSLFSKFEKKVDPGAWHFLTGDEQSIMRFADAIGFRFQRDGEEFKHAGTVVFAARDGKIVQYLAGEVLLPFDLAMGVKAATEGSPRTLIQRVQKLCFAYAPEGRNTVLKVNQIILYVTLFGVAVFALVLFARRRSPRGGVATGDEPASPEERPV